MSTFTARLARDTETPVESWGLEHTGGGCWVAVVPVTDTRYVLVSEFHPNNAEQEDGFALGVYPNYEQWDIGEYPTSFEEDLSYEQLLAKLKELIDG